MSNLIILDIDNTLMDSESKKKIYFKKPNSIFFGIKNYSRPYLIKFIKQCFKTFSYVAIWTAASKDWANNFINNILHMKRNDFLFVWDISQCSSKNSYYCKPLKKVWIKYPQFNNTNSFIIDDRIKNNVFNKKNFLLIPSYSINLGNKDNTLLQLIVYFQKYDWNKYDIKCIIKYITLKNYLT